MKKLNIMYKEAGQVILILILVMTVGLGIGLSVVQKSLVDVSTASKVEQSSRAFSAAEAGVEKALRGDTSTDFTSTTSQITDIQGVALLPSIPGPNTPQAALQLPLLYREDMAQVWLADYNSTSNPPPAVYKQPTLDIYWGNSSTDKAALEITLIYHNGTSYQSRKWFLDSDSSRATTNKFEAVSCPGTYLFGTTVFQCKKTLGNNAGINNNPLPVVSPNILMAIRIRLLYNSTPQPVAVQAVGCCGDGFNLPPQARLIISTGASGDTQRKISLFQLYKVVPPYFDYAIFSAGEINK